MEVGIQRSQVEWYRVIWREQPQDIHLFFSWRLRKYCWHKNLGSVNLKMIRQCLNQFKDISGLIANQRKSHNISKWGSTRSKERSIIDNLGFQEGTLPIEYLGVTLISTRLEKMDCKALVVLEVGHSSTCLMQEEFNWSSQSYMQSNVTGQHSSFFPKVLFLPLKAPLRGFFGKEVFWAREELKLRGKRPLFQWRRESLDCWTLKHGTKQPFWRMFGTF